MSCVCVCTTYFSWVALIYIYLNRVIFVMAAQLWDTFWNAPLCSIMIIHLFLFGFCSGFPFRCISIEIRQYTCSKHHATWIYCMVSLLTQTNEAISLLFSLSLSRLPPISMLKRVTLPFFPRSTLLQIAPTQFHSHGKRHILSLKKKVKRKAFVCMI